MDKTTVERAIAALVQIGAAHVPEPRPKPYPPTSNATQHPRCEGIAACGSPNCAGCYDVGDGKRIHPPKSSPERLAWLERWKPKGPSQ